MSDYSFAYVFVHRSCFAFLDPCLQLPFCWTHRSLVYTISSTWHQDVYQAHAHGFASGGLAHDSQRALFWKRCQDRKTSPSKQTKHTIAQTPQVAVVYEHTTCQQSFASNCHPMFLQLHRILWDQNISARRPFSLALGMLSGILGSNQMSVW